VRMEEGSLRADANISIRPVGEETFGTKTELKNLKSFALVRDGIAEEAKRQAKVLDANEEVVQSSRRYDEKTKKYVLMRVKGDENEYRIFPELNIPTIHINENWKERIRKEIPELPDARRLRYVNDMDLPAYDAEVLTATKEMSDFFE